MSIVKLLDTKGRNRRQWRHFHTHGLTVHTVKIAVLPKATYKFNMVLIKIPITL